MESTSHQWKSQWLFVLAAVGAAAGLGNLWRFPYMVYEHGGSSFIIAYLICLFVMVIPLMMVEVALGQTERKEFVALLGDKAKWLGRTVAWMMILLIILLLGYYVPVASWGVNYFYHSFSVAWGADAQSFFYNNVLQLTDSPAEFGSFSIPIVIGLTVSYIAVYFSIFRGLESISKVIKWTVFLPLILLLILFVNSIFLPGSSDGFLYLLTPDFSKLFTIEVWKNAASQSFLSANVGLIITLFYAGFNAKKTNIVRSTIWIALGNALVSFLAAFAIFGTLGYTALQKGVEITEVVASGPTLAFVAFPDALATLPFAQSIFAVLFFVTVFTLAIDTIFAALEVVISTLRSEFAALRRLPKEKMLAVSCILLFCWSLAFAGGNGLYRLDAMDHALWAHLFYWAVIPQIIIIGWFTPVSALRKRINESGGIQLGSWFDVIVKYVAPLFLIVLYVSSLPAEFSGSYEGYSHTFLSYWFYGPIVVAVLLSGLLALRKSRSAKLTD